MDEPPEREGENRQATERPRPFRDTVLPFVPLGAGGLAALGAVFIAPERATKDLYVVAAQVIPVLLLALALEARIFRPVAPPIGSPLEEPEELLATADALEISVKDMQHRLQELVGGSDETKRQFEEWERRTDQLEEEARHLLESDPAAGETLDAVDRLREETQLAKEQHASRQNELRNWVREVAQQRTLVSQQQRRIKRLRRMQRVARFTWASNNAAYIGFGILVLAGGELQSLVRIADDDFSGKPGLVFAAMAYGFAAVFFTAVFKRDR